MGTVVVPLNVRDVNTFIQSHAPGTTFKFRRGLYRMLGRILPRNGDQFVGTEEEGQRVSVISGARIIKNWRFESRYWVSDNQAHGEPFADDVCLPEHPRCTYPDDLFIDDEMLEHVATKEQVRPGAWHFDYDNNDIYLGDNPRGRLVELSSQQHFFSPVSTGVSNILLEDLIIEKFATPTGNGALNLGASSLGGRNWECRACEIRYCHGGAIWNDSETISRYNYIHHCGGMALQGAGANILIEGNEIAYNNPFGYNPYWGAGGSKWVWTTDLIVRGNYSHHNMGVGLWTDINNINSTYEDNVVEYNWLAGIFHEISYDAIIRRNRCRHNGLEKTWPWWTANAGIAVCNSRNVEVYENELEENWQEITGVQDSRTSGGSFGPYELTNFRVHHNKVKSTKLPEGSGRSGVVSPHAFNYDFNNYTVGPNFVHPFFINESNMGWEDWRTRGQDLNGTFTRLT